MAGFDSVFSRIEKKYLLNAAQYEALMQRIGDRIVEDKFGLSNIMSLYFDTPTNLLIRTSLEKPVYKEKLRLRSYGIPTDSSEVFIELKRKCKKVVYKRRIKSSYKNAIEYLTEGASLSEDSQITHEIDAFLEFYKTLKPSMLIMCKRHAFISVNDPSLRITFDSDLLWRNYELNMKYGIYGQSLLDRSGRLMEIKCANALPVWFADALNALEIFPTSYSKYGNAYRAVNSHEPLIINLNQINIGGNSIYA